MNNSIKIVVIFLIAFSSMSCDRDADFQSGVFVNPEISIIETDVISARYQENEQQVKFIIEDLLNTSDDREEPFPVLDFLTLGVDMNNNNLPDNNLDKRYSKSSGGENCMQFILQEGNAGTGCIQEEGYTYSVDFASSSAFGEEHIIYEFIMNKDNVFTESETVGLVFMLRGNDSGGAIPSEEFPSFIETIEFSL